MSERQALRGIRKFIVGYLLLSGLVANLLIFGGAYWHYRRASQPLDLYLYDLGARLEERSPRLAPVNRAIHRLFFDSGLLADPAVRYARDIPFELPRWRGHGASALRHDSAPRYGSLGQPISLADNGLWELQTSPALDEVRVVTVSALQTAIDQARPGTAIILGPGVYRLPAGMVLHARQAGTAKRPIVLRGEAIDQVILEVAEADTLDIDAPYWAVSDLVVRGRCRPAVCRSLIAAGPHASALTLRNVFASGFRHLVSSHGGDEPPFRLADGITLLGTAVVDRGTGWRLADNRILGTDSRDVSHLCPVEGDRELCDSTSLQQSVNKAAPNTLLLLRAGRYRQGARIRTPGLHLIGEPGAVLYRSAVAGKGALVSNEDLTIEGLACEGIKVASGNGACVRQQGGDLTLLGVHFHHAQMGVLTGHKGGSIRVYDSYLHDSGYDEDGQLGHNIYVGSGDFHFIRSWSVNARHEGHELKSRAQVTEIRNAFLASLNAKDSRLVDAPNAGLVTIEDSLLAEGQRSSNWQLIGYGLEIRGERKPPHPDNRLIVRHNTIYSDRAGSSELIGARWAEKQLVEDNILVGKLGEWPGNTRYDDRDAAGVPPYPALPDLMAP